MGYIVIQGSPLCLAAIEEVPQEDVVELQALSLRHSHLEDVAFPQVRRQVLQTLQAPPQDDLMSTKLNLLHRGRNVIYTSGQGESLAVFNASKVYCHVVPGQLLKTWQCLNAMLVSRHIVT